MNIKMKWHFLPIKWENFTEVTSQQALSYTTSRNVNWYHPPGK